MLLQGFYPEVLFAAAVAVVAAASVAGRSYSSISRQKKKKGFAYVVEKKREVDEGEKKREVYAVFETSLKGLFSYKDEYLIYKLEETAGGEKEFGQPIGTIRSGECPMAMSIFSLGSKIYFCGGVQLDPIFETRSIDSIYSCRAYMFDVSSKQGTPIQSMHYPKPVPFVFGPDEKNRFYVFSPPHPRNMGCFDTDTKCSMECFDTDTNTWEALSVPHHLESMDLNQASVLCGSNILFSPANGANLYVFCTRSSIWRLLIKEGPEAYFLPFAKARYLFYKKNIGHFLFASPSDGALPELYMSADLPLLENGDDPVGPFKHLGMVEGLTLNNNFKAIPEFLGGWGVIEGFYYLDTHSFKSICLVRSKVPGFAGVRVGPRGRPYDHFVIDIYNVSYNGLDGSTEVKTKVENSLQYRYTSKISMTPRHVLAVE